MLLDHFHPPLSQNFGWQSFHSQWAAVIVADLNDRLPEGWHAEASAEFEVERDVGVVGEPDEHPLQSATTRWQPPVPTTTIPFALTDRIQVRVVNPSYGPSLMGAIELVSPSNKELPEHRNAFVSKCVNVVSEGAGLMIVDIATEHDSNLHGAFLERLNDEWSDPTDLYVSAYFPTNGEDRDSQKLNIWYEPLEIGQSLPTMPLGLRVGPVMPINLETTYSQACKQARIPINNPNRFQQHVHLSQ